jgi:hypothetical protein
MQGGEKVFVDELDVHGLNSFFPMMPNIAHADGNILS